MVNLRVIFRSFKKKFIYTWINVLSLGVALCFVFLTITYAVHEYSFDQSYPFSEKIHRLVLTGYKSNVLGNRFEHAYTMADNYEKKYPAIEDVVRFYTNVYDSKLVKPKDNRERAFEESDFYHVEDGFLEMFGVEAVSGGFEMFNVPGTVLISESAKEKFFAQEYAIGEKLLLGDDEFEVVGVYKDFAPNSSISPRFIISLKDWESDEAYSEYLKNKGYSMFHCFIAINSGADLDRLEEELTKQGKEGEYFYFDEKFELEPLQDYHFSELDLVKPFAAKADEKLLTWLITISICLLAVAIANFGNISFALAFDKRKDVAIHKIIGARKEQLIRGSLVESLLLSLFSFVLALVLVELMIPVYSNFVERDLTTQIFGPWTYPILSLFACLVGLIAGIYPSLIISNFSISGLFNSFGAGGKSKSLLRKALLGFQFFIAFGIISVMLFMNRQLSFMMSKDPGFEFQNTLVLESGWSSFRHETTIQTFKDRLMAIHGIEDVALSTDYPMHAVDVNDLERAGLFNGWENISMLKVGVDCNFFDFYNIQTDFNNELVSLFCEDSQVTLFNEAASGVVGETLNLDPVGQRLPAHSGKAKPGYIIQEGYVNDFHYSSVSEPIFPIAFVPLSMINGSTFFSIKFGENVNLGKLSKDIQDLWWEYEPTEPFSMKLLEEEHQRLYSSELKMMQMTTILGIGVCLIAFAGVFALSVFYGRERLKEISIRKVLGAGVSQLFRLQNQSFVTTLIIATLIAVPAVMIVVDYWISQFAYQTDQPVILFVVSGLIMLVATILSSGWYTAKVARVNPAEILRNN